MSEITDINYSNLANAIVKKACDDYIVEMHEHSSKKPSKNLFKKYRAFFGSDWYYTLTNLDHTSLLKILFEKEGHRTSSHILSYEKKYWGID